ncbi:mitogen-activated protein kinase kinase kinase YODA isoform X1 [Elaeis guineensis]|uniref:mitogen-activated protein kinase kinase kinase n=1 Tax=Elaeis guineensis var. tenera TaxID=51953 RepID=A0A8N4EXM2_ELAGV|nr:mitogen-activated protein kinase kinase kinase YODA isoform X1 [Elaeis guineensis]XP_029117274.1 mitogen-activated protein kinase kinase kinase YODA isoform X1 [Elaeis guineensis]XP_029117275.1 mitogen-activated protein kinase kinase kinase YODA isoform X1 [Elaeis guineensis]XP_029117276.1 mitogen-activated protein kinase kinase kinase YODA isoform X1 [Elaeis guineensis]XP_029117277.1 mitogen-activated protein kinase kinase kinase YODA isoform X1 [Elaeis guineensis]
MPSWWGKSSSKDVKKKTAKENLIDTFHRFINPTDQKGVVKSGGTRRRSNDITSEKGSRSRVESRSTSPSTQVSRCQSFADRPHAQPLPLPGLCSGIMRTSSDVSTSKPMLEKRGRPQLHLPLPRPNHNPKRPDPTDMDGDFAIASFSSNCSVDSDDPADSQLQSPIGNDLENGNRGIANNQSSVGHKDQSPVATRKNSREMTKPTNLIFANQILSTSPKQGVLNSNQSNIHVPLPGVFGSAPDSSMSSPSRSPMRVVCPEQIPASAFWAAKPHADVTFLGSGQCSSPGSGQTSGHNSVGGDMLGQLFWQHSRGSPECSPMPSPRMTSPGPSSRIHSGTVSPLHPRAGGTAPESPTSRHDDGKKQSHRLPLPPINISASPFPSNNTTSNTTSSIPRSPGRAENPTSPGSRWKKGKLIGRGTFGHVYVGFNSESGEMCAMKEVTLFMDDAKSKESAKQLGQEISLLSRLRHQNIVQYYGSEMIDDKLYIYLEYVSGGSIHKLLQEYGKLGEPAIRSYTQQILSGLAYLHAKNTVHRDIKGANILVDPNGRVKLADFGMAKHITGQSCPLSFKGSPYWMAPEVIKNTNGCNLAVDIWSLGCTVFEMATSKPPWSQYEGIAAMFKIGNSKELPAIPDHLSDEGKDFIRQCLQREPSNRPTAAELLQHPFVQTAALLEKSVFNFELLKRPTVVSSGPNSKVNFHGVGHARNLSSLDMEGVAIHQIRGAKACTMSSDIHMRNISCPVSPIGSPLLNSRSPQHINGRMSPSPISSPRTTSGSSTPLTGGNGAIPFSHPNQSAYLREGFIGMLRSPHDLCTSGTTYHDPKLDLFIGMQQGSPVLRERMASEADILGTQFGRAGPGNLWDPCDRQSVMDYHVPHQILRDPTKLNVSLDLKP